MSLLNLRVCLIFNLIQIMHKHNEGFTLLELLIVIAIIAILSVVVFLVIDPLTRFEDARNANRWEAVTTILDAVKISQVDNKGYFPTTVNSTVAGSFYMIGTCTPTSTLACTGATTTAGCVDLGSLVTSGYMASVPQDPNTGTASTTGYYLSKTGVGVITIGACSPENSAIISVMR